MAAPIGPGDWVECVDVSPCRTCGPPPLREGSVYRVEDIVPARHPDNIWGTLLILCEVRSAGSQGGFGIGRFRPIYRPSADFIASLQRPVSAPVRELIDAEGAASARHRAMGPDSSRAGSGLADDDRYQEITAGGIPTAGGEGKHPGHDPQEARQ